MVLLVLKAHRALHFGNRIDEVAQRVAGQGVIVAAGVDVLERAGLVVAPFGIEAFKEEALDLAGRVERVAFLRITFVGELLERAANVTGKRPSLAVEDVAEDEHLPRPEDVRRSPIKRAPVER